MQNNCRYCKITCCQCIIAAAVAIPVVDTAMPVATAGSAEQVERLAENLQMIACAIRFMEFGSTSNPTTGMRLFYMNENTLTVTL